jgi:hypothetical protein
MKRHAWIAVLLVTSAVTQPGVVGREQGLRKTCDPRLGNAEVTQNEVLADRYPSTRWYSVSDACARRMQERINEWYQQDLARWDQLATRACSYALGWVEYHPGVCQAGGPPPICVANHWYRDPNRAKAQQEEENARVRRERTDELSKMACDCSAQEIRESAAPSLEATTSSVSATTIPSPSGLSLPCSGSCPIPGYNCVNGFCQAAAAIVQAAQASPYLRPSDTTALVDRVAKALGALNRPVLAPPGASAIVATPSSPWISSYRFSANAIQGHARDLQAALTTLQRISEQGGDARAAISDARAKRLQLQSDMSMMSSAASEIARNGFVPAPACSAVFEAENGVLADTVATIMGREISTDAWPSGTRRGWPLDYGYIHIDVSCGPQRESVRYLSQVFSFCSPEVSEAKVISDNALFFRQVQASTCSDPVERLSAYIVRERSPSSAEQTRARDSRERRGRVVPWHASVEYYGTACR